jgi:hypothetical protein
MKRYNLIRLNYIAAIRDAEKSYHNNYDEILNMKYLYG